ncbi:MAG: TetR family transcriptional regulator [Trueperaceae bacterium]|nr:TetR family transcriptional regulator [Trueperaceae bacterium]
MDPERADAYAEAKQAARDAVAERLLDLTDARLAEEGPAGLSMRRLANAAGCSTMVFYTAFGTKGGLLDALAAREAARWADEALTLADPDPVAWLDATGRALLALGASRPHHRELVLGPGAIETLADAVRAAVRRAWPDPAPGGDEVAAAVWSAWRGALVVSDPGEAALVHGGVVRLWSAAVADAQRRGGVVG